MTRRAGAGLIGLIAVLLAVVPGAVPAWAGSLARTMPAQPGPPTGLTATVASSSEIDLSWTPPSGDPPATSYDVWYGTVQGTEDTPANSDPIQGTTYDVTGLANCQTYYFVVDAVDADGNVSSDSTEVPASTCPTPSVSSGGGSSTSLAAPTGLNATAVSTSEIDLTWTAPSDDARAEYNVFDSTTQGQEQTNPAVNGQAIQGTSYQVTGLDSCQTYYFEVDSAYSGGNIASSEEESAKTFCPTPSPAAAVATAGPSSNSTGPGGTNLLPILLAVGGGALIVWWWRRRKRRRRRRAAPPDAPTPQTPPASSVHAVAHAGPPGVVVIRPTGTDATLTVRVESHKAPSITTIEEVPPR